MTIESRRPTVAHFMPWSGIGGVEIATLRMTEATNHLFRNVAFCLPDAHALRSKFEQAGVETVTFHPPEPSLRHAINFYKASERVAQDLRSIKADVVHFSDEKAAYHNSFAAVLARTRIVSHFRVTYPTLSLRQRLCLLPIHSFIFVSKEVRRTFAMSLSAGRGRVIYDPVDVSEGDNAASAFAVRRELHIPPGTRVVGMVARVNPQKDYFTLAHAAAAVLAKHADTMFLIVGDNSNVKNNRQHYGEVMQVLEELNIADRFIFTGYRSDVSRLISAMDICVLSTHREGFGLCLIEAMAMRKPVVATAVGGVPEVVVQGVSGLLHEHGNSRELADAVNFLIESPEEAKRLALGGYQHVQRVFSRAAFVEGISEVYLEVMHPKSKRRSGDERKPSERYSKSRPASQRGDNCLQP